MRKAFSERFKKRHGDIDFEDKEARYGALNDDADRLDDYEKSGRALSDVFDKHRWFAAMLMDLRDNPDSDPVQWMASNGVDIQEAMEDPEYRKKISDLIGEHQRKQMEGEEAERERETNLGKSAQALGSLGLSDDENSELWNHFMQDVLAPALRGEISAETWKAVRKARDYDKDVAGAREQGGMQARNEKIQNKLKKPEGEVLPPSLPQGGGNGAKIAAQGEKSEAGSFWEDFSS